MDDLEALVGEWGIGGPPPAEPLGRVAFEWMAGRRFLVQRWESEPPEFPDGLAVIGAAESGDGYLQHYFDSRGVARRYEMSLRDGVWKLWRTAEAPDFSQRFTGRLSDDGNTIDAKWEICHDGSTWEHDFDLVYKRA